jgi:flagellar biosynthetic protein FlhB
MSEERTEAATPRRREEVRKKGQTSRSHDLTSAAVLLAGLYGIKALSASMAGKFSGLITGSIAAAGSIDKAAKPTAGVDYFGAITSLLPPLLGLMAFVAIAVSVLQAGMIFAPGAMAPKFERINPLAGFKRIVSMQGLMASGKTLAKFLAVGATVGLVLQGNFDKLSTIGMLDLMPAVSVVIGVIWDAIFKSAIAILVLGVLDFVWERRRFLKSIRMTKQEVKQEMRQSEGDPLVKGQQKRRREQMLREMMKNVRTADVLVMNPKHFAVALKYDPLTMVAPQVIAKGQDLVALQMRETAREVGVPVVENPPLARTLYRLVKVGREIPADLYMAVAEILAFVFRLKAEHKGDHTVSSRPAPAPAGR